MAPPEPGQAQQEQQRSRDRGQLPVPGPLRAPAPGLGFYPKEDSPLCSFFSDLGKWERREAPSLSREDEELGQNLPAIAKDPEPRIPRAELPDPKVCFAALTSIIAFQFKKGVLCLKSWKERER